MTHTESDPSLQERPSVSVVVPVLNEEAVLESFDRRLRHVLNPLGQSWEVVYVDDGSTDATAAILGRLRAAHGNVCIISLTRNFGKEVALTAGLDLCRGRDVVINMDADLEDPPELLPEMLAVWRQGFDVVCAERSERPGDTWLKRNLAAAFYRVMRSLGGRVRLPSNVGDFRLLSRRAVDALLLLRERHRFMKGLFAWIGFPTRTVPFVRQQRGAGATKWNYWKLLDLSIEGITSFSTVPLRVATFLGLTTAIFAVLYAVVVTVRTLVYGNPVPGYTSLMVAVLFFSGLQMLMLGILGEYVGRIFNEVKMRPLYLVQQHLPSLVAARPNAADGQG